MLLRDVVRSFIMQAVQITSASPLAGGSGCCMPLVIGERLAIALLTVIQPLIIGRGCAEIH